MPENIIQRQTENLRRSYNMQPAMGLNGGRTQSLTQPEQLNKLLSGMGRVIESASLEIQRRQSEPGTLIGMGISGPNQIARSRRLSQGSRTSRRTLTPINRRRNSNGKVSPSGMPGRRSYLGAGRPKGS